MTIFYVICLILSCLLNVYFLINIFQLLKLKNHVAKHQNLIEEQFVINKEHELLIEKQNQIIEDHKKVTSDHHHNIKILSESVNNLNINIIHVKKAIEIVVITSPNQILKQAFYKLANLSDKGILEFEPTKQCHEELINYLLTIKKDFDKTKIVASLPDEKIRAEKASTEINNILMLLNTVDENSSKDHITRIYNEINLSFNKMSGTEE